MDVGNADIAGGNICPCSRQLGISLNIFVLFVFFVDQMIFLG